MSIVATVALLLFILAAWSEAAYYASGIEFNELLTWDKMRPALASVRLTHFGCLGGIAIPMESIAVFGMIASIGIGLVSRWRPPTWLIVMYVGLFLVAGGWMGLIALLCTLHPLDGEFLDEGMARMDACGLWMIVVVAYLGNRLYRHRKHTEHHPAPYPEPHTVQEG